MASLKEVLEELQKKIDKLSDSAREELEKKVKKEMEEEIFNLYIQTTIEWDNYMQSYTPKMYDRTGETKRGIVLDPTLRRDSFGNLIMSVEFLDEFMYEDEILTQTPRHKYMAINNGWDLRDEVSEGKEPKNRFHYYDDGYGQLDTTIRKYLQQKPEWLRLTVEWEGEDYYG